MKKVLSGLLAGAALLAVSAAPSFAGWHQGGWNGGWRGGWRAPVVFVGPSRCGDTRAAGLRAANSAVLVLLSEPRRLLSVGAGVPEWVGAGAAAPPAIGAASGPARAARS
jgi:hypothetical protein